MAHFEHTIHVNRPVQEVWDYMTVAANNVHWMAMAETIEQLSDGPIGVGTQVRQSGK